MPGLLCVPLHILANNDRTASEEHPSPVQWQVHSFLSTRTLQPRAWKKEYNCFILSPGLLLKSKPSYQVPSGK